MKHIRLNVTGAALRPAVPRPVTPCLLGDAPLRPAEPCRFPPFVRALTLLSLAHQYASQTSPRTESSRSWVVRQRAGRQTPGAAPLPHSALPYRVWPHDRDDLWPL